MAYTDATTNSASYKESKPNVTEWDSGDTQWDLIGNVAVTHWDIAPPTFTPATGNTPVYTEQ